MLRKILFILMYGSTILGIYLSLVKPAFTVYLYLCIFIVCMGWSLLGPDIKDKYLFGPLVIYAGYQMSNDGVTSTGSIMVTQDILLLFLVLYVSWGAYQLKKSR